ncbi:MAG: thioredoxin family protein [Alphaproteobacteria bacterium]|nr:thioredoxin family protein [Alphaproteobacteria bacterium]
MLNGLRSLLALLACALLFASPAYAQGGRENAIRAELFAEGPAVAGEEWTLALHFTPVSEEWHGYWRNPGDAGYGMELDWALPAGWEAGEPLYPVPERLVISGLMNHIYEGAYTVLVPVRVPAGADVGDMPPIAVEADYLACTDTICVPQQARLTLDPSNIARDPRFDRWRAAIAPLLDREGSFAIAGNRLRVAIPVPAELDLGAPHVFVGEPDLVDYTARQAFFRDGDRLVAEIPLGRGQVPGSLSGILSFGGSEAQGLRFAAQAGEVPRSGTPLALPADALPSVGLALLGALLGGLLLNVMPCVFPILSLKALSLARAGGDERAARRDAVFYTLGVVLACLALGALLLGLRAAGEQIGWAFQLQEPAVVVALLVLAAAITANFAGVFELPGLVMRGGRGGASSFGTGLLAAFVATPCTGPFMAAAMGAALLLPVPQALALFAALGMGLALPFLLLGFVPGLRRALPRPGPWMASFRRWMALPMGLTALALVWLLWRMAGAGFALTALGLAAGAVLLLAVLFARRAGRFRVAGVLVALAAMAGFAVLLPGQHAEPAQARQSIHDPRPFSEAALAAARATGQPVFVWFTADWCVTCKVNESAAIEREAVRAAFAEAGVITLVGDWTRRDEAIARFLTDQGAAGVPLYLWYPAGGEPRQLPQVLTPDLLASLPR